MIRKSQTFFYSCFAFTLGVALASFANFPWQILYAAILVGVLICLFAQKKTIFHLIGFCLIFTCLGAIRFLLSDPAINQKHLAFYAQGKQYSFRGIISEEVDLRYDRQKLTIKSTEIKNHDQWQKVRGLALITTGLFPKYAYGDYLEISCRLKRPEKIEDFDYDLYLAKANIYAVCSQGKIAILDQGQGNYFKELILKLKSKIVETVQAILPEPQSSFLAGLLWGAKQGLPAEVTENFNRTGVTHIVAVSGYNITIIAAALSGFFMAFGLTKKKTFILILLAIIFFVIITGAPASIVRAGIMGVLVLLSVNFGRATKMRNILAIVCCLMLLNNPRILIWDAGFQLSFLATIGLIYFSPILERPFKKVPDFWQLKSSFVSTLSAIILTSPLIVFQFGRFSLMAPVVNILILPAVPLNMAIGFLAVVTGLIYLPLAKVIGVISWLGLSYILKIVEFFAKFKFSSLEISGFSLSFMIICYLIIIYLVKKTVHE